MNLNEFIKKYSGKKVDWDGYYGGQCVDLARQYIDEVLELNQPRGVRGACNFWDNFDSDQNLNGQFEKIKNTLPFIPQAGDIMIWDCSVGGGYGHISIVTEADINKFTSFDQNWRALNVCELTKHDYKNVLGVFRKKELSEKENAKEILTRIEKDIAKLKGLI